MARKPIDTSNLTGGQIQEVFDFLIYHGLEPVLKYSTIFDVQVVYLLGIATTNKKRKISALDRDVSITQLSNILATTDSEKKLELLSKSKIERGFVYGFLVNFLNSTEDYVDLYTKYLTCSDVIAKKTLDMKLAVMERNVGFSRDHLFSTLNICRQYVNMAYEFRNFIVSHYLKHGYKLAHAHCKQKISSGGTFDLKEVYQSLMAAITKAIDKYDSSQGALTSYINYWILNALTYSNSQYGFEYGVAYTMPTLQKRNIQGTKAADINYGISLDSMLTSDGSDDSIGLQDILEGASGVDQSIEETEELDTIHYLIKSADYRGIARLYLDIDEYISKKERVRMIRTMYKQTGRIPSGVDPELVALAMKSQ
jgi:hypothetical protein